MTIKEVLKALRLLKSGTTGTTIKEVLLSNKKDKSGSTIAEVLASTVNEHSDEPVT